MRTYECGCGATLFFENTVCQACNRTVGWCDSCQAVTSLSEDQCCERPGCGERLEFCSNRSSYDVCTAMLPAGENFSGLCKSCRRTTVIPDPSDPAQLVSWRLLEAGKRRLLYDLALVGVCGKRLDGDPRLTFRFMADTPDEHVITGHADGVITINLAEADPVEREKNRQRFSEPQRTIIGHFRHEVGHYLWSLLVENHRLEEFKQLFGDHEQPPYPDAMQNYYNAGPPEDWQERFISQYASSHPWEDFAETAAFYLDMRSVLDTLDCHTPGLSADDHSDIDEMLKAHLHAGIVLNEINRSIGLTDLVPEIISPAVVEKLRFVHELLQAGVLQPAA